MVLIAALQKHPGQHLESSLDIKGRTPIVLVLFNPVFVAPDAEGAVETDSIQHETETEVCALQGLFFVVLPAFAPIADRVVVVCGEVHNSALHVHAHSEALVVVLEIMVVEERPSCNGVRIKIGSIHQTEVGIDSLTALKSVP